MNQMYNNKTNAAGIHITEASPIDDRKYIETEAEIAVLENIEPFPSIMYNGMVVQITENRKEYIWVESSIGLMAVGYTYPEYMDDIQGQNYANKTYNLVLYDRVSKVSVTFTNVNDAGLFIANKYLPQHILNDKESAQVMLKSSESSYEEIEWPDKIVVDTTGITVILDPKPIVSENFKVTIS
jgi:hypothetical protein